MPTLEERVQRIEDIEAIRRIKMRYSSYCDEGYPADKISGLFVEDGVWDGGAFGVFEGRQAIHDGFVKMPDIISFAMHYVMNHEVDVAQSGTEATGQVYFFGTHTINGKAMFLSLIYDETYKKVDGQWYFNVVKLNLNYVTPYESGWVKQRMAV